MLKYRRNSIEPTILFQLCVRPFLNGGQQSHSHLIVVPVEEREIAPFVKGNGIDVPGGQEDGSVMIFEVKNKGWKRFEMFACVRRTARSRVRAHGSEQCKHLLCRVQGLLGRLEALFGVSRRSYACRTVRKRVDRTFVL